MKSLLEKLSLNKDTNIYLDSLLKAHINARREAKKYDEEYVVLKTKSGEYYYKQESGYKVGDSCDGDDVLEVIKP